MKDREQLIIPTNGCTVNHRCWFFQQKAKRYSVLNTPLIELDCTEDREIPEWCTRNTQSPVRTVDPEFPQPVTKGEMRALYNSPRLQFNISDL